MDFEKYLKITAKEVDLKLNNIFKAWRISAKKVDPKLLPLVDMSIDACSGGKRLRAALVKLGFLLSGAKYNPEILKPAAAFEIFQTAILMHDDVIDQSPLRRGKPTMYQALGGNHYGMSQAICAGDVGYFMALETLSEANFASKYLNQAINSFTKSMLETALGQMLDVELSQPKSKKDEKSAMTIIELKTARYTIVGPMQLGAILGGANQKLLNQIKKFGDNLGIAYQIQDDILGVFGDEKSLGKSITSDIAEGKNTLLITQALKKADPAQKKLLKALYGNPKITLAQLEKIRQLFIKTGALDYSRSQALKYVNLAKAVLPKITKSPEQRTLLTGMADFLINRNK